MTIDRRLTLLVVPAHRGHVTAPKQSVRLEPGTMLALDDHAGRLIVVDCVSPVLGWERGRRVPVQQATAALERLLPVNIEALDLWEAEFGGHVLQATPSSDVPPSHETWDVVERIDRISLSVNHRTGPIAVAFRPSDEAMTPSDAATELLTSLIPLASRSRTASRVVESLLRGQQIQLVTPNHEQPTRILGFMNAPIRMGYDYGQVVVWNRRRSRQAAFILEAGSELFGGPLDRSHMGFVSTSAILGACNILEDRLRRVPTPAGLYTAALDEVKEWQLVTDVHVHRIDDDWGIVLLPAAQEDESVQVGPTVVLSSGGTRLTVHLRERLPLADFCSLLERTARKSSNFGAEIVGADRPLTPWPGIDAAIADTMASAMDQADPQTGPDESGDRIAALLQTVESGLPLDEQHLKPLAPDDLGALLGRWPGVQAVAVIQLELILRDRRIGLPAHLEQFADALTTCLAATNATHETTPASAMARVTGMAVEWLTGQRPSTQTPPRISRAAVTGHRQWEWQRLVARAPWLSWFLDVDSRRQPTVLTAAGLVEMIALLRPRYQPGPVRAGSNVPGQVPSRWESLFRTSDLLNLTDDGLGALCTSVELALFDPAAAARQVQRLGLPDAVRRDLLRVVEAWVPPDAGPTAMLAVHVAGQHSDTVFVNLSEYRRLFVETAEETLSLPPRATSEPGAHDYVSARIEVGQGQPVVVGGTRIDLDHADPGLDSGVGFTHYAVGEWFRGRAEQVAALTSAFEQRTLRVPSLILGARRAGKSTLAWHIGQDARAQGRVWLDLGDTSVTVRDFGSWRESILRQLTRQVRRELGMDPAFPTTDLVECLTHLDDLLDGRGPVVMVLDELDVLLSPADTNDGRRTAGRLGATGFRNLLVIGTMQRFHHNTSEFKVWQHVQCPADLRWVDGLTYFMEPLAHTAEGPRVEYLRRSAAGPRELARTIVPRIGLRPYFWGQLRNQMESLVRAGISEHRMMTDTQLVSLLDQLAADDAHLASIFDRGEGLDREELQRRDLFSEEERRILARFAQLPTEQNSISVAAALHVTDGADWAVNELVERAFCRVDGAGRLEIAVPIYLEFLRYRARDLLALVGDLPSPLGRDDIAKGSDGALLNPLLADPPAHRTTLPPDVLTTAKAILHESLQAQPFQRAADLGSLLRGVVPGPKWGAQQTLTDWLTTHFPQYPVTRWPVVEGTVWSSHGALTDAELNGLPASIPAEDYLDKARLAVAQEFAAGRLFVSSGELANRLRELIPGPNWDGRSTFSKWFTTYFPDRPTSNNPYAEGTIWANPGAQVRGAAADQDGSPLDAEPTAEAIAIVQEILTASRYVSAARMGNALRPHLPLTWGRHRTFTRWMAAHFPEHPVARWPFVEGTVWASADDLDDARRDDNVPPAKRGGEVEEVDEAVATRVAEIFAEVPYVAAGPLGNQLRDLVPGPGWGGFSTFLKWMAAILPDRPITFAPYPTGTVWANAQTRDTTDPADVVRRPRAGAFQDPVFAPGQLAAAGELVLRMLDQTPHALPIPIVGQALRAEGMLPSRRRNQPSPFGLVLNWLVDKANDHVAVERLPWPGFVLDPTRHVIPDWQPPQAEVSPPD